MLTLILDGVQGDKGGARRVGPVVGLSLGRLCKTVQASNKHGCLLQFLTLRGVQRGVLGSGREERVVALGRRSKTVHASS